MDKASAVGTDSAVGVRGEDGLSYCRLPGHHDSGVIARRHRVCGPPIYIPPPTTALSPDHQASSVLHLAFFCFPTPRPNLNPWRPHCHPWIHRWLRSPAARAANTLTNASSSGTPLRQHTACNGFGYYSCSYFLWFLSVLSFLYPI